MAFEDGGEPQPVEGKARKRAVERGIGAGMPFGLQVTGRFRGDAALLGAAQAMEQGFAAIPELRRPKPDLRKLAKPVPALKSIVTHPPRTVRRASANEAVSAGAI